MDFNIKRTNKLDKKKYIIERLKIKLHTFLELTGKNKTEALLEALEIAIAVKRRTLPVRLIVSEPITGRLFRLRPSQLPKYTDLLRVLNGDPELSEKEIKQLVLSLRKKYEEIERNKIKEFMREIKWEYIYRKHEQNKEMRKIIKRKK